MKKCLARIRRERLGSLVDKYENKEIDINEMCKLGKIIETEIRNATNTLNFSIKFGKTKLCKEEFVD